MFTDLTLDTLRHAYVSGGFKTKSDYARNHATLVATAASLGFISTILPGDIATDTWRVTSKGLTLLEKHGNTTR